MTLRGEGFPDGSVSKESACNAGDSSSIPGSGRIPGEGNSYPLQYSGLENSMDYPWGCKESDTTEQLTLYVKWDLFFFAVFSSFYKPYYPM